MKKSRFRVVITLSILVLLSTILMNHRAPISAALKRSQRLHLTTSPRSEMVSKIAKTRNNVGVTFSSEAPIWAENAEEIMAELEIWREKAFVRPLEIQIKPRESNEPAGWYSPETQQLIVTSDGSEEFRRGVMLHEIFHALQDQSFDLLSLHELAKTEDANQALDALIEGEAMLAVSDLLDYDFAAHAKLPPDGEISDALFNRLFEYGDGMAFVRSRRESGGWDAVNQVFQAPPQSTAEIYHPATYPETSQGKIDASSQMGEYGFRQWLARSPKTRSHLIDLGDAYQSDTLSLSETGEHTWHIEFKTQESAAMIAKLAPEAIAMMPDHPKSFEVSQNQQALTLVWQAPNDPL